MEELKTNDNKSEDWGDEAWQNWLGFCDLIVKEYIKQNPEEYKKVKNNG